MYLFIINDDVFDLDRKLNFTSSYIGCVLLNNMFDLVVVFL